ILDAQEAGLRRSRSGERVEAVGRRRRRALDQARARRAQFAPERRAGGMRARNGKRKFGGDRGPRRRPRGGPGGGGAPAGGGGGGGCLGGRSGRLVARWNSRPIAASAASSPAGASSVTPNGVPSGRIEAGTARPHISRRLAKLV